MTAKERRIRHDGLHLPFLVVSGHRWSVEQGAKDCVGIGEVGECRVGAGRAKVLDPIRPGRDRHGAGPEPRRAPAPRSTATSTTGRASGTIKWFNEDKGFGFIVEDGGEDVFVHMSALQEAGIRTLAEGDRVEFDIMPGAKGKQATNVAKLD